MMDKGHIEQNPDSSSPQYSPHVPPPDALSDVARLVTQLDEDQNAPSVSEQGAHCTDTEPMPDSLPAAPNELAGSRLGPCNGLFIALKAKHAPTASHCLRVALTCSAWARRQELLPEQRETLEAAALLHDVGKIGVSDDVLFKPSALSRDDLVHLDRYRTHSLEILIASGASRELIDVAFYASAWFDGSRTAFELNGDRIPVSARMLAIVDAFDSMTTEQVHRRARSNDEAITELFRSAGSQFDPDLVTSFAHFIDQYPPAQQIDVANQWLRDIASRSDAKLWSNTSHVPRVDVGTQQVFQSQLLECLSEAVVFVDAQMRVIVWNSAAERLTGINSSGVEQTRWDPALIRLRDEEGNVVSGPACPVSWVINSREASTMKALITGRAAKTVHVEIQVRPVIDCAEILQGAIIVLEDMSSEVSLAKRLETLHAKVALDPLTKVANRAEIDRVHQELVTVATETQSPMAMMICDLDFFKSVNDEYGHQVGDEALMFFSSLMRRFKRSGDLVGRYGGEEFVMLCAECEISGITERAESIRRALETTRLEFLEHKCLTASFGVTELQPGDTSETMLRRADRALFKAKESGRNRVIQCGGHISVDESVAIEPPVKGLFGMFRAPKTDILAEMRMVASVPIDLAVEKFRGFVADRNAQVINVDGNRAEIKVDGRTLAQQRRESDRSVPFIVALDFANARESELQLPEKFHTGTLISVVIKPIRNRDRRRRGLEEQLSNLMTSLKAYFMAMDLKDFDRPSVERAVTGPGR